MSSTLKIFAALGTIAFIAACEREVEEPVYVEPAPVVAEPTYQKY